MHQVQETNSEEEISFQIYNTFQTSNF